MFLLYNDNPQTAEALGVTFTVHVIVNFGVIHLLLTLLVVVQAWFLFFHVALNNVHVCKAMELVGYYYEELFEIN